MPITSKDEYLKASRAQQPGFGSTIDFTDPHVGATVQSKGGIPVLPEGLPGQVFSVDQLPDPAVAKAYGLPAMVIPEHLISEDEIHLQGKTPEDVASAELRRKLNDPVLSFDNTVKSSEDSVKSLVDLPTSTKAFGPGLTDNSNKEVPPAGDGSSVPATDESSPALVMTPGTPVPAS